MLPQHRDTALDVQCWKPVYKIPSRRHNACPLARDRIGQKVLVSRVMQVVLLNQQFESAAARTPLILGSCATVAAGNSPQDQIVLMNQKQNLYLMPVQNTTGETDRVAQDNHRYSTSLTIPRSLVGNLY